MSILQLSTVDQARLTGCKIKILSNDYEAGIISYTVDQMFNTEAPGVAQ